MESWIELVISIVGGLAVFMGHLWVIYKVIKKISDSRRNRIREDYLFLKEYLILVKDPSSDDYLVESGFYYLTRYQVKASIIRFLFTQKNPTMLVKNYTLGNRYLIVILSKRKQVVKKIKGKTYLRLNLNWVKKCHVGMYIIFAFLAYAPFVPVTHDLVKHPLPKLGIGLFVLGCIFIALASLFESMRVLSAEEFLQQLEENKGKLN